MKLSINGSVYAIYENIEAVDKEFLEDHFGNADGNLYKHFLASELKTNEDVGDTSDLYALQDSFERKEEWLYENLDCAVNVRQWVRLLAAEATLPASDNFWSSDFNLYAYNDPNSGWVVIPWDLDDVMYDNADWDVSLEDGGPDGIGDWWALMRGNPVWRVWFLEDVKETLDGAYRGLPDQVNAWCCALRDEVAALPDVQFSGVESFDESCREVRAQIRCRIKYLDNVLGGGSGDIECDPSELEKNGEVDLSCE